MANFICFDLEGPLSPQDNAYELMKLFPNGDRIFEVISRYDDLLTLEEKEDYEPGDTLALIVPFLILHNISENDITTLAAKASLTGGAAKLISWLQYSGWKVFCISTSYEQYALHITQKLGIYAHNVACTPFPLNKLRATLCQEEVQLLQQAEQDILTMRPVADDERIKQSLDSFFWEKLPATDLGAAITQVKPVGGRRKVAALTRFAEAYDQPLSKWVVVGDSITDFRMLQAVEEAGGLAIAFNANEYALPYATMGLASTLLSDLQEVLEAWQKSKRGWVERVVKYKEKWGNKGDGGYFHWLSGRKDIDEVIKIHKRIRRLVREEAGKLGMNTMGEVIEIVGLGALNIDHIYKVERILDDGEAVVEKAKSSPGGSAANTIYGLAKLGVSAGFCGVVGDDDEGKILLQDFQQVGVDIGQIRVKHGEKTGSVLCLSDKLGRRSLYVLPGANNLLTLDDLDLTYINQGRMLHLSSFADDRQFKISLELVDKLDSSVKLSFAPGALYAAKGLKALAPILSRTYLLFINQHEIRQLTREDIISRGKKLS